MVERKTLKLLATLSISLVVAVNSATAGPKVNYAPSHSEINSFTSGKRASIGGFNTRLKGDNPDGSYSKAFLDHKNAGMPQEESDDGAPEPFMSHVPMYYTGAFKESLPSKSGTQVPPNLPSLGSPINLPLDIVTTESSLPTAACELPTINLQCSVGTLKFFIPISPLELLEKETQLLKFVNSIWHANGRPPSASHMGR